MLKETIAFIVNVSITGHKEKLRQLSLLSLLKQAREVE